MRKPKFRKKIPHVVVRPLRMGGKLLMPGDLISEIFPTVRLRRWYKRNRIGPVDSEWTEMMIKSFEEGTSIQRSIHREIKDESDTDEIKDKSDTDETKDKSDTDETKDKSDTDETKDEPDTDETKDESDTDETKDELGSIEPLGGGWYQVMIGGEVHKVKGKEAAEELLADGV